MQIGDLVRWETNGGEFEYGIVTSFDTYSFQHSGVMVYFFKDEGFSEMKKDGLVVVNESG